MLQYTVLSRLKSGGKIREIGECVDLDEKVAAALRPGSVELEPKPIATKPEPKPKPATAKAGTKKK